MAFLGPNCPSPWSAPVTIDAGTTSPLDAVSCPTATFCTAIDGWGQAFTYNGNTWSGPTYIDPAAQTGYGFTGISCPNAASCMAVDWEGNAITGSG